VTTEAASGHNQPRRIALIGFGEVGTRFAEGLIASGRHDVAAYDILFDDRREAPRLRAKARELKVEACASPAAAIAGARIVISAVTASSAQEAAHEAAKHMGPGQFFLDINSVSPETKRADEAAIVKSGAAYVEAAVMAAIAPYGLKVPMLLGGKPAAELATILNPAGMKMEPVAAIVGQASAIKMCRSVMIKGIEALVVEGFLAARHYGVEDKVIASLDETFPGLNWNRQVGYMLERVLIHGRRRAAEMREAADTVAAAGLEPLMSTATARRQDWLADQAAALPALKAAPEGEWRASLDQILKRLKPASAKAAE
jgi:3-hydroxyisobutyrate dehydrogenase-like beta-hydroxyacid dehydrogenase